MGVVQDWITFELAIRIRYSKGHSNISDQAKKLLKGVRAVLFAGMSILLAIYCSTIIISARKEKNHGLAFGLENNCLVVSTIGYLFLCQVIIMVLLVTWLFIETQRAVNRETKEYGNVMHKLKRERCTYALISTIFGVSYLGRFYLDAELFC